MSIVNILIVMATLTTVLQVLSAYSMVNSMVNTFDSGTIKIYTHLLDSSLHT